MAQPRSPLTENNKTHRHGRNGGHTRAKKLIIQSDASGFSEIGETAELRKPPIYKARALHIPYGSHRGTQGSTQANKDGQGAVFSPAAEARPLGAVISEFAKRIRPPEKQTDGLPLGSQAMFIDAVRCASVSGFSINTLLSIRWSSLLLVAFGDHGILPKTYTRNDQATTSRLILGRENPLSVFFVATSFQTSANLSEVAPLVAGKGPPGTMQHKARL